MRIDLGECVDGDPSCPGPVSPTNRKRCAECEQALEDHADVVATDRSFR